MTTQEKLNAHTGAGARGAVLWGLLQITGWATAADLAVEHSKRRVAAVLTDMAESGLLWRRRVLNRWEYQLGGEKRAALMGLIGMVAS